MLHKIFARLRGKKKPLESSRTIYLSKEMEKVQQTVRTLFEESLVRLEN